jgi:hypothetical protein
MRQALLDAYRRLPEAVRYSLRPMNALEESASFLPSGPRLAVLRAVSAYRTIRSAAKRRADVALLEGISRVDGAALRVVTDLSRDAEVYWKGLLFAAPPTRRVVGQVHGVLGFTRVALPEADLTLLALNRLARGRAQERGYLVMPAWVQTSLDTRRSVDAIAEGERSGRNSRKNDIRRTRKAGFVPVLVRSPSEVLHFFDAWWRPFVEARFGGELVAFSTDWARQMARVCDIMWIEREGIRVGGSLLEPRGRELRNVAFGVRDPSLVREGVLTACYWFMIEHAVREGYDSLQLGSSRPVLSDGVLRHKLKWGGVLTPVRQWDYFALGVARDSDAARAVLAAHPLVAEERRCFFAVTSGDAATLHPAFGLSGILAPEPNGWTTYPLVGDAA